MTLVERAMKQGPILAAARVERAMLDACPGMARSWAVAYVSRLVATGRLPEAEIGEALEKYRYVLSPEEDREPASVPGLDPQGAVGTQGVAVEKYGLRSNYA